MSQMIPQVVVDTFRQFNDFAVSIYGIDCTLHIPNNFDDVLQKDIYAEPSDYSYDDYTTQVVIEWSPNVSRLKSLGMYSEGDLPIIAYFPNKIADLDGIPQDVDIIKGSYLNISMGYIPDKFKTDAFDIVDVVLPRKQDAIMFQMYKIAPRRVKV
jgi:hypothetical protein